MDVAATVATSVAALAAVGSCLAAWQSRRAALRLAAIEQYCWHAELTPHFEVSCQACPGGRAELRVQFVGPTALDRLDRVTVTIRDDLRQVEPFSAGGPTRQDIARQVWGPYQFVPGVDGADETGRSAASVELVRGEWRPFELERTRPPRRAGRGSEADQWWQRRYAAAPVRLALRCERDGHEPWTVDRVVNVDGSQDARP